MSYEIVKSAGIKQIHNCTQMLLAALIQRMHLTNAWIYCTKKQNIWYVFNVILYS